MRDINQYGIEYSKLPFEKQMVRYRKKMLQEKVLCYPHRHILEIGCGLDPLFTTIKNFEHLTVIEPSLSFYKNTSQLLEKADLQNKVTLVNGFIEDHVCGLKNKGFDLIILSSLLHEIEYPDVLLKAVNTIAGSNAVIHINVPNAHSFHRLLAVEAGLITSKYEHSGTQIRLQQYHTFDLDSLSALCIKNSFTIIDKGSYFVKPFTHAQMAALIENDIIGSEVMDGFYEMTKYSPDLGAEIYINCKRNKCCKKEALGNCLNHNPTTTFSN